MPMLLRLLSVFTFLAYAENSLQPMDTPVDLEFQVRQ